MFHFRSSGAEAHPTELSLCCPASDLHEKDFTEDSSPLPRKSVLLFKLTHWLDQIKISSESNNRNRQVCQLNVRTLKIQQGASSAKLKFQQPRAEHDCTRGIIRKADAEFLGIHRSHLDPTVPGHHSHHFNYFPWVPMWPRGTDRTRLLEIPVRDSNKCPGVS